MSTLAAQVGLRVAYEHPMYPMSQDEVQTDVAAVVVYANMNEGKRNSVLHRARERAEAKGIPFTLTLETLPPEPDVCPIFGTPMVRGGHRDATPTLDRLVGSAGYTLENVWWISGRANRIKADASVPELYIIADAVWAEMKRRGLKVPPTRLRPEEK